jgi:hypothetical protein
MRIKADVDGIITAINHLPDGDNLSANDVTRLPQIIMNLITICKPRLARIKAEDIDLYIKFSSIVASNALGACIEFANRSHDAAKAMTIMTMIGELFMDLSLKERYNKNFQIMLSNVAVASKKASSGGCYIATMVYGSYDAPEVLILRKYRDSVLAQRAIGKVFIKYYYRLSPVFVARYKNNMTIHAIAKRLLDSIVRRLK